MPIHTTRVRALSSTSNNRHECMHSHPLSKESILHRYISEYVHGSVQCCGVVACTIYNFNRFSLQRGWVSAHKEGGWNTQTHTHANTLYTASDLFQTMFNVIVYHRTDTVRCKVSFSLKWIIAVYRLYRLSRSFEENTHQQQLRIGTLLWGTFSTYTYTFFLQYSAPLQIALTRCTAQVRAAVLFAFSAIRFGVTIEYFVRLSRKNVPIRTNARHNFGISLEWHPSKLITLAFYWITDELGCCYQVPMAFRHKTSHLINQSYRWRWTPTKNSKTATHK